MRFKSCTAALIAMIVCRRDSEATVRLCVIGHCIMSPSQGIWLNTVSTPRNCNIAGIILLLLSHRPDIALWSSTTPQSCQFIRAGGVCPSIVSSSTPSGTNPTISLIRNLAGLPVSLSPISTTLLCRNSTLFKNQVKARFGGY